MPVELLQQRYRTGSLTLFSFNCWILKILVTNVYLNMYTGSVHKEGEMLHTLKRVCRNLVCGGENARLGLRAAWEALERALGPLPGLMDCLCFLPDAPSASPSLPPSCHNSSLLPVHVLEIGNRMGGTGEGKGRKYESHKGGELQCHLPCSSGQLDDILS